MPWIAPEAMRVALSPHPDTPSSVVDRIEVEFHHEGRSSTLAKFRLYGRSVSIAIPPLSAAVEEAQRTRRELFVQNTLASGFAVKGGPSLAGVSEVGRENGLWRSTCFEVFAGLSDGRYAEFNVSPSKQWAAYMFEGYREGMRDLDGSADVIRVEQTSDSLEVHAFLNWSDWPRSRRVALSAVIEDVDGGISYWALTHPTGKPDFHHPDAFALVFP